MEAGFPGMDAFQRKGGRGWWVLLAVSGLSAGVGVLFVLVPWVPRSALAQMPYPACFDGFPRTWMGCFAGLNPWFPFALLFGGAAGIAVAIWRLR